MNTAQGEHKSKVDEKQEPDYWLKDIDTNKIHRPGAFMKRLMIELRTIFQDQNLKTEDNKEMLFYPPSSDLSGIMALLPTESFNKESNLYISLKICKCDGVLIELFFPEPRPEKQKDFYPWRPPVARVVHPKLRGGNTIDGAICFEGLMDKGWNPGFAGLKPLLMSIKVLPMFTQSEVEAIYQDQVVPGWNRETAERMWGKYSEYHKSDLSYNVSSAKQKS